MPPKSVNAFRVRDQVYVYLKNVTLDNGTKTNGYYPGVITAVRTEGAYAIRFDDGEAKDHVDKNGSSRKRISTSKIREVTKSL